MASKYWIPMTQGEYLSLFLLQILLNKETCTEQYHILNHSITSGHTSISNNFPANQLFYQSHLVETARSACRTTKYAISFWWASYGIPKSLPFALLSYLSMFSGLYKHSLYKHCFYFLLCSLF